MPKVIYNPAVESYDFGPGHPFDLKRGKAFMDVAMSHGILHESQIISAPPAARDDLESFHNSSFVQALKEVNRGEHDWHHLVYGLGQQDNPIFKGVLDLCLVFAGTALEACRHVLKSDDKSAFVPVGGFHHAMRSRAAGFCYINDIGIAITDLIESGLKVLYIDIDAHHGDGIQDAFYSDDRVLKMSFHESGKTLFPGTGFENEVGTGKGTGYTINVPMHSSADDETFLWLFRRIFPPVAERFDADVTIAEIGADMMSTDPLTNLKLTNNAYVEAVRTITAQAKRLIAFGGGGYNLNNVARCYTLAWAVFNNISVEDDPYAAMLGGNFLGSSEMNTLSSMLDMNVFISGPQKEEAMADAARVYSYLKENVLSRLGA